MRLYYKSLTFFGKNTQSLDKLLCDGRMRPEAAGILAWKEVRAMSEELREMEARLFRSLKEALAKNKALARSCLA